MEYSSTSGDPSARRDGRDEHRELYGGVGQVAKIVGVTTSIGVAVALLVVIVIALV